MHNTLYTQTGWTLERTLSKDASPGDFFGTAVASKNNYVAVGTFSTDVVKIYDFPPAADDIPTLSEWGVFVLTLLFLTTGSVCIQRRERMKRGAA